MFRGQRIAAGSVQSYIQPSGSHGDLDEFELESHAIVHDQVDFAQRVRTTIMFDYQDKEKEPGKGLCGFEVWQLQCSTNSAIFISSVLHVHVSHFMQMYAIDVCSTIIIIIKLYTMWVL